MRLWELNSVKKPKNEHYEVLRDTDGFARPLKKGWILEIQPTAMEGVITMYAYEDGKMVDGAEDYDVGNLRSLQREGSVRLREGEEPSPHLVIWDGDQTAHFVWDHDRTAPKRLKYFNDYQNETQFMIIQGRKILAAGGLQENPNNKENWWIKHISVDPDFMGRGYARQIMEAMFQFALKHKIKLSPSSFTKMGQERLLHIYNGLRYRYSDAVMDGTAGEPQMFEELSEDGKIIPNVNTTCDVQPGETQRQAIKFGNVLDSQGRPPLLCGSYGDDSARYSANQGDPSYGPDGTRLKAARK